MGLQERPDALSTVGFGEGKSNPGFRPGGPNRLRVPVVDAEGKPLMPCTPARARLLLKSGKVTCFLKCSENPVEVSLDGLVSLSAFLGVFAPVWLTRPFQSTPASMRGGFRTSPTGLWRSGITGGTEPTKSAIQRRPDGEAAYGNSRNPRKRLPVAFAEKITPFFPPCRGSRRETT